MDSFKTFLSEAKFDNNLDISVVKKLAKSNKSKIDMVALSVPEVLEAIEHFKNNIAAKPKVYIFAKTVAYRIGRSSIKSIDGFSSGFKTSFINSNEEMLDLSVLNQKTKRAQVIIFALWIAANHPNSISTEVDKAEKNETEETIRTQTSIDNILADINEDYLTLVLGRQQFKIDGFRQISGRPKADMAFTYKKKDVVFVSHKLGSKPADFQQYGGFSNDLGYNKNSRTSKIVKGSSSSYIDQFLEDVDLILANVYNIKPDKNGMYDFKSTKRGTNFAKPIDDDNLSGIVMFGKDYPTGKFGLDNCHVLVDGNIKFKMIEHGVYELDRSSPETYHIMNNPSVKGSTDKFPKKPPYQPMLFVMRSAAQGLNQGGFLNARAVVWPRNAVTENYYKKFKADLIKAKKLL
jgi:hypothetical protein